MKKVLTTGAALLLTTSVATAGGLDRSGQPVGIIFEDGNVFQFSYGYISPSVSGDATGAGLGGFNSGNMAEAYSQFGGGVKYDYSSNLSVALTFDEPYGADVDYSDAEVGYYTGPAFADVDSSAITALARYRIDDNISVHGGVRMQTVAAEVAKPTLENYAITGEESTAYGFVLGAAYEIPDIALRVAVTYNSKISHDIESTETCTSTIAATALLCAAPIVTTSSVDTPEAINIDFQTGVAADTLVFGSIRYAKWTQFDYAPTMHAALTSGDSLQSYDEDTVSYSLGVGRRFSDSLSGALSVGYEAAQGGFAGDLAPTDGNLSVGLGGTYTVGDSKITAGLRYIMLGDAETEHPLIDDAPGSEFSDNSAIAFGIQLTQSF